ncbi:MAG: transporter substrate-binding domain-containing protein [Desulfobacterales bacterium]|nr:transporter substrate-binding domain-containing protein [Desulfobacterales bacterium]MBF0395893.1 transporter substrate-binding domain-containing protein [Desulfobacterales bacterium]
MNKNFLTLSLICFCALVLYKYSWSKDTIIWGHACIPPLYFCEGDKVSGIGADIENIIFENIQEYNHNRLSSNLERIMENLKKQGLFCSSSISKNPEREEFLYYSIPEAIIPPIHIFIRKEDYANFGGSTMVSLEGTLKNKQLTFGYPSARSFGPEIDTIIKAHANDPHVSATYSSDISEQQIKLLANKRIDYTIGGYFAIKLAAKKQGVEDKIIALRVHEKQDYLVLYIVCPKTDWGKAMIGKINAILKNEIPKQRYFECFKPFYDEITKNEFKNQYEKLLIKATLN